MGGMYSCVSYVDVDGTARMIPSSDGSGYKTPSVMYVDPNTNEHIVGHRAKEASRIHYENSINSIKHYFSTYDFYCSINGKEYPPDLVVSYILQKLVNDVEAYFKDVEIEGAVLTCPVFYTQRNLSNLLSAAKKVTTKYGKPLKVHTVVSEPNAIAIAYDQLMNEDYSKTVLVFDLGGSMLDLTALQISSINGEKVLEILGMDGNHYMASDSWNHALKNYVMDEFMDRTGFDLYDANDDVELTKWFDENIEKAKITLSDCESVTLELSYAGMVEKFEITRELLDELTDPYLNGMIYTAKEMIQERLIGFDVDEVLLVGGGSKVPNVEHRIRKELNIPTKLFEPDFAVAKGAAILANTYSK